MKVVQKMGVIKKVKIGEREFELREPPGFEVDEFVARFLDDNMKVPREKIGEANVALIKMCFGLEEDEIKQLPNSVYRALLNEAADYFKNMGTMGDDIQKKPKS